jgi:hypothetical protein
MYPVVGASARSRIFGILANVSAAISCKSLILVLGALLDAPAKKFDIMALDILISCKRWDWNDEDFLWIYVQGSGNVVNFFVKYVE